MGRRTRGKQGFLKFQERVCSWRYCTLQGVKSILEYQSIRVFLSTVPWSSKNERSHVPSALLKLLSLGALFHTILSLSLSVKGGKARWHLKSAFPSPLCQSVLFFLTDSPLHLHTDMAHTYTHTHTASPCPLTMDVPGYHWCCVCLVDQTATSGPLNDALAGCGVTRGPIKSQTKHQICHIHFCDELLDIKLSPPNDRLSTPVSGWSISRLNPKTLSSHFLSPL